MLSVLALASHQVVHTQPEANLIPGMSPQYFAEHQTIGSDSDTGGSPPTKLPCQGISEKAGMNRSMTGFHSGA